MKRIIELPDSVVKAIQNGEDYRYDIHTAIAQSIPYNPSGDCISRSVVKGMISDKSIPIKFEKENRGDWQYSTGVLLCDICKAIDNAPTVDIKDQIAGAYNEGYMCGNKEAEKARPKLSDEQIDEITELLENEWGYEGMREEVSRILKGGAE